jgi:hypothetical protein
MPAPSRFPKLRTEEHSSRVQDNIDGTLGPIAEALNATPIMGADPPAWIRPNLLNDFVNVGGGNALVAYHKDALGYVHVKGVVTHVAGVGAGTSLFAFAMGYRPSEELLFAVYGTGATAQFLSVSADSNVYNQVAVAAGGIIGFTLSFLAEQ